MIALYALTSGLVAAAVFLVSLNLIRLPENTIRILLVALVILLSVGAVVVLWLGTPKWLPYAPSEPRKAGAQITSSTPA